MRGRGLWTGVIQVPHLVPWIPITQPVVQICDLEWVDLCDVPRLPVFAPINPNNPKEDFAVFSTGLQETSALEVASNHIASSSTQQLDSGARNKRQDAYSIITTFSTSS